MGGGGRGGIPASFPSRSPPPKQPFQPTPTPSPGSHQEVCEKIVIERFGWFCGEKAPAPGGPGPKPWGPGPQAPWRPGPQAPGAWIQVFNFYGSGSQNATTTPKPLILGGVGWFPKAELYSSPEPCIPVKNSKNAPVLIGS